MSSILSSTEAGVVGVAVGTGAAAAVEPVVEPAKQKVWEANAFKVLAPELLAELVVQALVTYDAAQGQAQRSGYDSNKFRAMVEATFKAPGTAEALELWRRERITKEQVTHALHKAGLEEQFIDPVLDLFSERLDPAVIATAVQRGIMKDPGFLPVGPPTGTGKVPAFPVSPLDTLLEAQASGINAERLFVETAIVGLPLSLQEAASAYFRGIIDLTDFERAVAEGNTRNEWGNAALAQARQILTAAQYAELQLRGFLTADERRAETGKHGMSDRDSDLLYDVLGRAINVHAVVTGEARGGTFDGPIADIPQPFLAAMRRSNIRPEYYSLAYANRYNYPSAFVLRALLQASVLTADEGYEIFLRIGWPPDLARKVADHYGTAAVAVADPNVKRAQTQLWTTTHRSYIASESNDADATARFDALGIPAAAQTEILALWQSERALIRKQLTPAQIKKAYQKVSRNYATGTAWTRDDALAALVARGYTVTEANDYLDIPSR